MSSNILQSKNKVLTGPVRTRAADNNNTENGNL